MKISVRSKSPFLFIDAKNIFLSIFCLSISITFSLGQNQPNLGKQKPNTQDNATVPSSGKKDKTKARTPANTTISSSGKRNKLKPNTKDNTTLSGSGQKDKSKANTPDNTTIGQPGDNKRFQSNKTSTTQNNNLKINEDIQKTKQKETGKFKGNDRLIMKPHHPNPALAEDREKTNVIPSQENYSQQ